MKNFEVMIDVETLGRRPNAAIVQIAAIPFYSDTGDALSHFTRNIDLDSAIGFGGTVDYSTIKFWMEQPAQCRTWMQEPRVNICDALRDFTNFLRPYKECDFWAHASFDYPIVLSAITHFGNVFDEPWVYRNALDLRTFFREKKYQFPKSDGTEIKHDALTDCAFQIRHLLLARKGGGA